MTKARNLSKLMSDNIVGTTELADNAVTTAKLANDAVTAAKLDIDGGDISYDNSVSGISATTLQAAIDYLNVLSGGGSAGAQATYTREEFTATAGQTTFTTVNGYTLGYLQVFMNGIMLDSGDYTANDESTVVLATGAAASDEVTTIAYDSFAISEVLRVMNISASAPNNVLSANANGSVSVNTPTGGGEILRLNGGTYTSAIYAGGLSVTSNTSSNYNRYWEMDASAGLKFTRKGTSDGVADGTPLSMNTTGIGVNYNSPQYAVHLGGGSAAKRRIFVDDINSAGANAGVMFRLADTNGATRTGGVYFEPRTGTDSFVGISGDNSSAHLSVGELGYITMPYQPAFNAKVNASTAYPSSGWNKISVGTLINQRGSHYSTANSRFTAPVSGWYQVNMSLNFNAANDTDGALGLAINGSQTNAGIAVMQAQNGGAYAGKAASGAVYLATGDYIEMHAYITVGMATRNNPWAGFFSGYLIG